MMKVLRGFTEADAKNLVFQMLDDCVAAGIEPFDYRETAGLVDLPPGYILPACVRRIYFDILAGRLRETGDEFAARYGFVL